MALNPPGSLLTVVPKNPRPISLSPAEMTSLWERLVATIPELIAATSRSHRNEAFNPEHI
jgi:hypothetical protein